MESNLQETIPYEPRPEVILTPREISEIIFLHYRGSGKNKRKYPPTLDGLTGTKMGVLRNFNPFILTLLQSPKEGSRKKNVHLTTPPLNRVGYKLPKLQDYGKKLRYNPEFFRNYTIDFGLVLRGIEGPNQILAEDLADQIQEKYGEIQFPLLISLRGTLLKYYPFSEYDGFSFKITDETEIMHTPILNQPGYFSRQDIDEQTSLPKQTRQEREKGDLELITSHPKTNQPISSGLTRAYINLWGDIDVGHPVLSRSEYSARLFIVKE